jgi:hypothetical protein
VRRHRLLATGISAALMIGGAATPVLARGPESSGRISGFGRTADKANFTASVRQDRPDKGHLDYRSADGRFRVRCDGFDSYSTRMYIQAGPPAAMVTGTCWLKGPRQRTKVTVQAEFVDNSSFARGKKDEANFTFMRPDGSEVTDSGPIRAGDVTVR